MWLVHLWWWFRHVIGVDNGSTGWYLWWSGIFGDAAIFGGILMLYWKHNCHQNGCFRLGKHSPNGTPYCTKHHPNLKETK